MSKTVLGNKHTESQMQTLICITTGLNEPEGMLQVSPLLPLTCHAYFQTTPPADLMHTTGHLCHVLSQQGL